MKQLLYILNSKKVKIVILFLLILYSVSFCFWGRGSNDPYYWLLQYKVKVSGLSFLTIFIGQNWCTLFGFSILSERILAWLCCIFAIFIPYTTIFKDFFNNKSYFPLCISILLLGYGDFNEFSPGTFSFLTLSCTIAIVYQFFNCDKNTKNYFFWLVIIGFTCAISTACRFPNVVALIIVILFTFIDSLLFRHKLADALLSGTIILLSFLISYFGIAFLCLEFCSPWTNLVSSFSKATGSGGHNIVGMIESTLYVGNIILQYCGVVSLLILGIIAQNKSRSKITRFIFFCIVISIECFFLFSEIKTRIWYNEHLHYLMSSICLLGMAWLCTRLLINKQIRECYLYFFVAMISVVGFVGSDVTLLKLFPFVLVLIPIICSRLELSYSPLALFAIALFSIYTLKSYGMNNISKGESSQKHILKTEGTVDNPVLKGILLSSDVIESVNMLESDYNAKGSFGGAIYYGEWAWFAYAITGADLLYEPNFWMAKNDSTEITKLFSVISEQRKPVLFDFRFNDSEFFKTQLDSNNYKLVQQGPKYNIYSYQTVQ